MRIGTFVRCALVAGIVSAAVATAPSAVAAGSGAVHVRSTDLSVYASLATELDGRSLGTDLTVTMTDEATGTASLQLQQWLWDENGVGIGWTSGTGDVHLEIGSALADATVTGTITVVRCTSAADGYCAAEETAVVPIDGRWTATSKILRTRTVSIVSASRTSREMMRSSASYRYAEAQVLLDGAPIGSVTWPTMATINDARTSVVDTYFGTTGLPGTLVASPMSVTPAAVATNGRTRFIGRWEAAEATWNQSAGGTLRATAFRASGDTVKSKSDWQIDQMAQYDDLIYVTDEWGNALPIQYTTGWGETGTLTVGRTLATASFTGSVDVQVCTSMSAWDMVCVEGGSIAIDLHWTSTGDVTRTLINQTYPAWDGSLHAMHNLMESVGAVASGTMGGDAFGPSDPGSIQRDMGTYDDSARG